MFMLALIFTPDTYSNNILCLSEMNTAEQNKTI